MSKGSKVRPTNKIEFDKNYDTIFGRKYVQQEMPDMETCPYCGILTESPCDAPPADYCEQAINEVHGAWLNDL